MNNKTKSSTHIVSSASFLEIQFGFDVIHTPPQQLCPDLGNGCPVLAGSNITIERIFNLSRIPLYPLADITAQYSAVSPDSSSLLCIKLAPVGYQHPVWRNVFIYLPVGFTVLAAITSLVVSLTSVEHGEHDMFLFSSNHAMLPGVLRLKTPGFVDLVYYSQFIVTAGQFNINYPRFHSLFTSNFSWSFLLFQSPWLADTILGMFQPENDELDRISSVPGLSIYRRQIAPLKNLVRMDATSVDIQGTGMSDFSTAIGMDINSLFFTVFVYFLIINAVALVLCFFTWIVFYTIGACSSRKVFTDRSLKMWDFTVGVLVRILTLLYLPLITAAFYQLMIPTHWYITTLAAIALVSSFLSYGLISIKLLQIRPKSYIFSDLKLLLRYGALYNTYTDNGSQFFVIIIAYKFVVAAMIGLFQTSGIAQLVFVLLAELAIFLVILFTSPYADKSVNYLHMTFGLIRFIVLILNIAYLDQVQATTHVKQYVGYVQLAIHCFAFLLFLILQVRNIAVVLVGLSEEELDEAGRPPARMVMWRKRKYSQPFYGQSSATLMTMASSRHQSSQVNLTGTRNSAQGTHNVALLSSYYTRISMKPDERDALDDRIVQEGRSNKYRNSTETASSSPKATLRFMDQGQSSQREPLRSDVLEPLITTQSPPPVPQHQIVDNRIL
ncbi:unnamed protein product [Rhizopus stolonifer]